MREVLTFVLAGGRGERLDPLTKDRTKPAVPFGGVYRIIDFTLSNCVNSGLRRVYILTQYKSFSLQKHILGGWDVVSSQLGEFIDIVPAQQRIGDEWYRGTADAIYQNIYTIEDLNPDLILILAGDHIYKMNYKKMIDFHREKKADLTVGCVPMPKETSRDFGVIQVDKDNRVLGFQEKPQDPKTIPGEPTRILASMGIYVFNKKALVHELELDNRNPFSQHDFGKNVIPQMVKENCNIYTYNFMDEKGEPYYWRDIGTRDAYYQANMDLLAEKPAFNLYDKSWPMRNYQEPYPPIRIVNTQCAGQIVNSMISGGCLIEGALVENSILSPGVKVRSCSEIKKSIIMENVTIGENVKIKNAIIDKEVIIPSNTRIGYDLESDRKQFVMTTSGVVMVPKRTSIGR